MFAILLLVLFAQQATVLSNESGVVTGRVRTAAGKPLAGVRVTAMVPPADGIDAVSASSMSSIAETDSEGRYRLENIPPGQYLISAGNIARPTYFPGTLDFARGQRVRVAPREVVANIDFPLQEDSAGRASVVFSTAVVGLNIPVSIKMEASGPVPVFQRGTYPLFTLTEISTSFRYEFTLNTTTVNLPVPPANGTEYKVAFEGLQDGYSVKSMTYGTTDLLKENLKATRQGLSSGSFSVFAGPLGPTGPLGGTSAFPLNVVLSRATPSAPPAGVRVTGTSVGDGDEIYISDEPGYVYADGSFEFRDVPPGQHNIVKFYKNSVTTAAVTVGARDVDGVRLQRPFLLPVDMFTRGGVKPDGALPPSAAHGPIALHVRVLDAVSKEPLDGGTVTVSGYQNTRSNVAILGEGTVDVRDLLPGLYNLTLNVFGYKNTTQPITVGVNDMNLEILAEKTP